MRFVKDGQKSDFFLLNSVSLYQWIRKEYRLHAMFHKEDERDGGIDGLVLFGHQELRLQFRYS